MNLTPNQTETLYSEQYFKSKGIEIDKYPADAVFGEKTNCPLIGTYNHNRTEVCITIQDNCTTAQIENLDCNITLEVIKEIAMTVNVIHTNMGIDLHRTTKNGNKYLKQLKIKRLNEC